MRTSIGDALFTKAQQKILAMLFGQPDRSFYLREVVRLADIGVGDISRELGKLTDAGLLVSSKQGNQNHYQENESNPIFIELVNIVKKTFGVKGALQTALAPLLPNLEQAFIYGSIAKGEEHAGSDIDVMLVGDDLSYTEVMTLLEPVELQLQRTINPTIYSTTELNERQAQGQNFLTKVMTQPKIDLKSDS